MKIKGAIFDMDGTLIDSLSFFSFFWRSVGIKYKNDPHFVPEESIDKRFRTSIFTDALTELKRHFALPGEKEELFRFANDCLRRFYKEEAKVKPGAIPLLLHLQSKGIKLCLASATAMNELHYALVSHGLDCFFERVLSCADIGKGKEHPHIFLAALEAMHLTPEEVCVFEDSFVALETAKKEGFQTVGVYAANNFDQERLKLSADIYVGRDEPLDSLIPFIE